MATTAVAQGGEREQAWVIIGFGNGRCEKKGTELYGEVA